MERLQEGLDWLGRQPPYIQILAGGIMGAPIGAGFILLFSWVAS